MDINGAKHTNDDDALREAIRISELESKAARAAAAAQAAAEAAIAAAKEAAAMQAEAEAAMTEARKSRETLAKQGSEVHVPLARSDGRHTRSHGAAAAARSSSGGTRHSCRNRRTYDTKGCRIFRGGV
jgi:hypothetical protein